MSHVIEHAASGRAKCRGCGEKIDKDELRFGEKEPNAFGDGEMTLWFHIPCAAYKRPEPFLEMLGEVEAQDISTDEMATAQAFRQVADFGIEHRRVPRLDKVDRAILDALCSRFGGGPVGLAITAVTVAVVGLALEYQKLNGIVEAAEEGARLGHHEVSGRRHGRCRRGLGGLG